VGLRTVISSIVCLTGKRAQITLPRLLPLSYFSLLRHLDRHLHDVLQFNLALIALGNHLGTHILRDDQDLVLVLVDVGVFEVKDGLVIVVGLDNGDVLEGW